MSLFDLLGLVEPLSLAVALVVLGLLSRRLGKASHIRPRYTGFFVGAGLLVFSAAARFANLLFGWIKPEQIPSSLVWTVLYTGVPALGLTVGLIAAWRYWSWLLAERS
jgi:hypothetical protein